MSETVKPLTQDERLQAMFATAMPVNPPLANEWRDLFDRYEATVKDLERQLASPAPAPSDEVTDEYHWALARGYDLKAPHWDDLGPVMQEQVRRIVVNVSAILASRSASEDTARLDWLEKQTDADIRAWAWVSVAGQEGWTIADATLRWQVGESWQGDGATLREAIDAARRAPAMEQDNG